MRKDKKFESFLKSFQNLKGEKGKCGLVLNHVTLRNIEAIEAFINNPDDAEAEKKIGDNFASGQQGGGSRSPSELLADVKEKDSSEQRSVVLLAEALDYLRDDSNDRPAFISGPLNNQVQHFADSNMLPNRPPVVS